MEFKISKVDFMIIFTSDYQDLKIYEDCPLLDISMKITERFLDIKIILNLDYSKFLENLPSALLKFYKVCMKIHKI